MSEQNFKWVLSVLERKIRYGKYSNKIREKRRTKRG